MSAALSTSTIRRQARILITPPPSTLYESNAILKRLQSFGPISTFLNPRYVPVLKSHAPSTFYAIFADVEALDSARAASPLTIEVGHDAVDPEEADPFNVRGLWGRKQVERKTFRCRVHGDNRSNLRHRKVIEGNVYNGPFRLDRLAVGFQDLMKQGAPLPEFADSFQNRRMDDSDRAKFEAVAMKTSAWQSNNDSENTSGLMATWRQSVNSDQQTKLKRTS